MSLFLVKARTALALGPGNLCRALGYRLGVKTGLNPVRRLQAQTPEGPFFVAPQPSLRQLPGTSQWYESVLYYGYWTVAQQDSPPDWHLNPLTGVRVPSPDRPWWLIADFDPSVGDIKSIWEASRFDWVLAFAQGACQGDSTALPRLNLWLADWCRHNPPYHGPNWKCGQEASIRVLHLAMSAVLLGQHDAIQPGLAALIEVHLKRIAPTISYAMAQDNNHGTSEAAALYVGGSWLMSSGHTAARGWFEAGRRWLENRAARLIERDGSFSQYSVNYHRVMLDTFSMVEVWRRKCELAPFSPTWYARAKAASQWLFVMTDAATGDAPNLGANDGARLLALSDTDYRDYRPSVQLAMALFDERRAYADSGSWDLPLQWLQVTQPEALAERPVSRLFDQGGYAVLHQPGCKAVLRYPRFRFRPGQADALHVDLWLEGRNLLRDAGSFSYNCEPQWLRYFPGTASHNTVQFDDRDQMPRLSRFLFGDWLRAVDVQPPCDGGDTTSCGATYTDGKGAQHARSLSLGPLSLQVRDQVSGFSSRAVLRWRLEPGDWVLQGNGVSNGSHRLSVTGDVPLVRCELVTGWESRYYLEKTPVPVLEVEVATAGVLITEYHW